MEKDASLLLQQMPGAGSNRPRVIPVVSNPPTPLEVLPQGHFVHSHVRKQVDIPNSATHPLHCSHKCRRRSLSLPGPIYSALVFFLALLFFFPVFRASGCSRILRISSSVIFLSVWYLLRSRGVGPPSLEMPFFVMAGNRY